MELLRGLHNLKPEHQGCVLSIGNFDGVHLGHSAVLSRLLVEAQRLQLPSTVLTFEPQPEELFAGDNAPARLSRLRDKFVQLEKLGLARLLCESFTHKFANLSAQEFVDELLIKKLGVKFLVIGDDFHFGYQRKGDFKLLKNATLQKLENYENEGVGIYWKDLDEDLSLRGFLVNELIAA